MPISTHQKLTSLRRELATKPHSEVLRLYLHQNGDELFNSAILVALHRSWSPKPPSALTAIGITTYDRRAVNHGLPLTPGPHAEDLLEQTWCMSLQVESNTPRNRSTGNGILPFHFGTTIFTSKAETEELLRQIWHQPIDEKAEEGLRPIILLCYSNDEATARIFRKAFDTIPSSFPTTIATLEAQVIACQSKITSDPSATLEHLLSTFKISCPDLANAGNTATLCMVASILSVLRRQLYEAENNKGVRPGQYGMSRDRSAQQVIQSLVCRKTPAPPFGTPA